MRRVAAIVTVGVFAAAIGAGCRSPREPNAPPLYSGAAAAPSAHP